MLKEGHTFETSLAHQEDNQTPIQFNSIQFKKKKKKPNTNTGYWIDFIGPDRQKAGELPLKFITTDEFGDRWATLQLEANHWWIIEASLVL